MKTLRTLALSIVVLLALAPAASAGTATLTWVDNSSGDAQTAQADIMRVVVPNAGACTSATTGFVKIGFVLAPILTYVDATVVAPNTYYYEVIAKNIAGDSGPSNTGSKTVPFVVPPALSNLLVR